MIPSFIDSSLINTPPSIVRGREELSVVSTKVFTFVVDHYSDHKVQSHSDQRCTLGL